MKEKVKLPIRNVIIKKKDILELANVIFLQDNKREITYQIKFKNEQEISGDDISIFKNRKFEEYEIKMICMRYYSKDFEDEINIYIYNDDVNEYSNIEISSNKSEWLALTEKQINETISLCEKQNKIGSIIRNPVIKSILAAIIAFLMSFFIALFIDKVVVGDKEAIFILQATLATLSCIISILLCEKLGQVYPSVEIIVTENNNLNKKRKVVIGICTLIIIPIIVNGIYDLVKMVINKLL